jgi:CHAD domain-containing protein
MAFKFKKTQSLAENLLRLYKKGAKKVVLALDQSGGLPGIHEARKEIKRLRAVLRLLRPEMSGRDCRRAMRPLRKAAKLLGPPRDARVLLETLNQLGSRFKGALPQKSLAHLKNMLVENCETARTQFAGNHAARRVCRFLKKSQKRARKISLKRKSRRRLEQNLGKSFAGSRTAFENAQAGQSPENFHEWRKRVQDVRNQIELLDSRKEISLTSDLKDLSQILGREHDIFMLREFVEAHYAGRAQKLKIRPLNESLKSFEEKLQVTALTRGTTFYGESPFDLRSGSSATKLLS